ncbi:MAG: hypothetical protein E6H00_12965 [Bacillati bacterium ANGP1]|uniref:Uncharacterized protein n=1 Tax=Candidatus Segetimicrobium genomatis TaxID=2569760 RepID=A0A537JXR7_9BACT|nr:MAG: hypothetical protein E6H00_12965 [Terrabacteria group bacterium ANGP1]
MAVEETPSYKAPGWYAAELQARIRAALDLAAHYGTIDGEDHKMWVIDQMVRRLTGGTYPSWCADRIDEQRGYTWRQGIAP